MTTLDDVMEEIDYLEKAHAIETRALGVLYLQRRMHGMATVPTVVLEQIQGREAAVKDLQLRHTRLLPELVRLGGADRPALAFAIEPAPAEQPNPNAELYARRLAVYEAARAVVRDLADGTVNAGLLDALIEAMDVAQFLFNLTVRTQLGRLITLAEDLRRAEMTIHYATTYPSEGSITLLRAAERTRADLISQTAALDRLLTAAITPYLAVA